MNPSPQRLGILKLLRIPLQTLIVGICLVSSGVRTQPLPLTENLINFNSPEGEKLLVESNARKDYFPRGS